MLKLTIPVVVEGKHDKARLATVIDATILTTDGFGIFKNEEKRALLKKLGAHGLVILCDSDGGGKTIRSHLSTHLSGIKTYNLYIPAVEGKERRKRTPSKEGLLGVEGIPNQTLTEIFEKFRMTHPELFADGQEAEAPPKSPITTAKLYELGLTGTPDSSAKRDEMAKALGLPKGMGAKQFVEALTLIGAEI